MVGRSVVGVVVAGIAIAAGTELAAGTAALVASVVGVAAAAAAAVPCSESLDQFPRATEMDWLQNHRRWKSSSS